MSAERLREAAALMRERAEAATEGPWECQPYGIRHTRDVMWDINSAEENVGSLNSEVDGTHIASWHPVVALAVANWLDRVAADEPSWGYAHSATEAESALAVADAYLGSAS